jgi:hypothetical protein
MPSFQPIYNGAVANGDVATARKNRGLTPACWRGISTSVIDPSLGWFYLNDFHEPPPQATSGVAAHAILTAKTAGTTNVILTEENGVLEIDAASGTADQGANVQFRGPTVKPSSWSVVAFETYVRTDDLGTGAAANGQNIVLGLCNYDTSVLLNGAIDSSANGITDYALFVSISSAATWNAANKWSFRMTKDNSTVVTQADIGSLVDGAVTATGWKKLGVRIEPGKQVELFFDGVKVSSSSIAVTSVPDAILVPTFVVESEGTVDPILNVDWFAVGVA